MPCSSFKLQTTSDPFLYPQIHSTILGKHLQIQGTLQSSSFTPEEGWNHWPLTLHLFPWQSFLFVFLPLTADQGPFVGSSLDQSISVGVSKVLLFLSVTLKQMVGIQLQYFPGLSPGLLSSQPACFPKEPTSFPFCSILTLPEMSGLVCI